MAEPTAELVRTVGGSLPAPADELHVAATLESKGVTDAVARDSYGHRDVFALAGTVLGALGGARLAQPEETRRPPARRLPVLLHGPLYALPTLVYPAVFHALGMAAAVPALVFATASGWVFGMGMAAAAHWLTGTGRPAAAAMAMRAFALAGVAFAAAGAAVLAALGGYGAGVLAFAVAQVAFQLATGILVFRGLEHRVALLMVPGCLAGLVHLASGRAGTTTVSALLAAGLSVLLLVLAAALATREPGRLPGFGGLARIVLPAMCYAAACAALLLFTAARYVTAGWELAVAAAPLVLAMGTLEWRSHRFDEQAAGLLRKASSAAGFSSAVWRVLLRELTACLLVLGGLGLLLLGTLAAAGLLTSRGALLVDAHILLGSAYFAGFVLANRGQAGRLLGVAAGMVAVNVLATLTLARFLEPHGEIPIFFGSSALLLLLLLAALRTSLGRVHHYQ
ncbi:hypothetical protein [Amycolatopsis aidingensis]|uniref:hypothetical protein n=1 Tax=Amycolatopsis aidingensis TaxID=2842453 RepID=UPI001C0C3AFB|nr:hypothetical protein [Amycolatopsis aidingensis]